MIRNVLIVHLNLHILLNLQVKWKELTSILQENALDNSAKKYPIHDADVVIPVPDSARPAALGFAQELGIQFDEGLLKDSYSKKGPLRSFIEPHQSDRVEINRWIIPIREVIEDKHIVVIDDKLSVRGTSSKAIIKALRRSGAKKLVC